jgi:DNA-directed RNA polymerase specialized sigma24 family protein
VDWEELAQIWEQLEPPPPRDPSLDNGNPHGTHSGLRLAEPGVVTDAAIVVACNACRRIARRQPVDLGNRSLKVDWVHWHTCPDCAKLGCSSYPKHPGAGRVKKLEEYWAFAAAMEAWEAYEYSGSEKPRRDAVREIERFLREWMDLQYSRELKTRMKGYEIHSDPISYYFEAFLSVMKWASRTPLRTKADLELGKTNWFFSNDETKKYLLVSIHRKAKQLVAKDGEAQRDRGLPEYDPEEHPRHDLGNAPWEDPTTWATGGTRRTAATDGTSEEDWVRGKDAGTPVPQDRYKDAPLTPPGDPLPKEYLRSPLVEPGEHDLYWKAQRLRYDEDAKGALEPAKKIVTAEQGKVLKLRATTELVYRDIGTRLGKALSTVQELHERAKKTVREEQLAQRLGYGHHERGEHAWVKRQRRERELKRLHKILKKILTKKRPKYGKDPKTPASI